jgi:hypothetical protein
MWPVLAWLRALPKDTGRSWLPYNVQVTPRLGGLNNLIGVSPVRLEVSSQKNPLPLPLTVCGRCVVPPITEVWYVYQCSWGRHMSPARPDLQTLCLPGIQSCCLAKHLAERVPPMPLFTAFQLLPPPETLHPPLWHRVCHLLDEAL